MLLCLLHAHENLIGRPDALVGGRAESSKLIALPFILIFTFQRGSSWRRSGEEVSRGGVTLELFHELSSRREEQRIQALPQITMIQ